MLFPLSLISYLLFFTFLAWHRFHLGLFFLFLLLPTYLIRFPLGPLPTTLLEVMLWIVTIIWLIKYNKSIVYRLSPIIYRHLSLFIAISLFLLAATISIFTSSDLRSALGEWKSFYIEPIIIFLILITTLNKKQPTNTQKISNFQFPISNKFSISQFLNFPISSPINTIIFALILFGLLTSLLAIYQHFTGWLVPYTFWQYQNTFRVTAWYGFPNAVGLFLAPLIPFALYLIKQNWKLIKNSKIQDTNKFKNLNIKYLILNIVCILYLVSSILAIIFSRGTGPLVGLIAGIGFLLLMHKKTRWPALIVGLVGLAGLVGLSSSNSLKQELLFQDRSGQIRLSIWSETWQFLKDNPLSGAGLASYVEKIQPYHHVVNGEGIEIFHHPHNIFLTMWVNLGLLGLIAFILILFWFFRLSLIAYRLSCNNITIYLAASMLTLLVMGLVDSPYIKNDLSIFFWLLPALLIINQYELEKPKT